MSGVAKVELGRHIRAAVSFLPAECRVSVEAFRPSAHPGRTEGKGRGGGEQRGGVLPVEPKVKGCHGPANGDGELTLKLTLPVRGEDMQFGWVHRLLGDRSPLLLICLSVCLSFSLSLSPSHSFSQFSSLPICM